MKQTSFFKRPLKEFGGSLSQQRKMTRTLSRNHPMHLVLKSRLFILFKNKALLDHVLKRQSKTFGVKIYSQSIQKNHWHICLKITNRQLYRGFIRALTGVLARHLGRGLWSLLPYTRVIQWGRDFEYVLNYILLNEYEVQGIVPLALRI